MKSDGTLFIGLADVAELLPFANASKRSKKCSVCRAKERFRHRKS